MLVGADGLAPLIAFGLGGFAGGAALRQLVLATRRQGWRGLVGRANGGMVVHLGVILIAVALAASNSYTRVGEFTLQQGEPVAFAGHTFELVEVRAFSDGPRQRREGRRAASTAARRTARRITRFTQRRHRHRHAERARPGSPRTSTSRSSPASQAGDTQATIKVFIKPMIVWLWIGGGMMAVGTVLAAFPGKRRRLPTSPASARIPTGDRPEPSPDADA